MRSRLRAPLAMLAAAAAVLTVAMVACRFTDDLTGVPIDASDDASCNIAQCPSGPNGAPVCSGSNCDLLCAPGYANCDDAGENGCETPILNANGPQQPAWKKYGRCGHDCLGGACVNGACQPVRLASGNHTPDRIVLADDDIYGVNTSTGDITKIPKAGVSGGGSPPVLYHEPHDVSPPLALGNTALYYVVSGAGDAGAVRMMHFDGGASTLAPASAPSSLALVDNNALYWVEGTADPSIHKCAPSSCAPVTLAVDAGASPVSATAADGQGVYWANNDGIFSSGSTVLSIAAPHPYGLELVSGNLYYFEPSPSGAAIRACDHLGCSVPTTVVSGQFSPRAMAIDGSGVFWTTTDGAIKTIPRAENPPATVEKILYQRHTKFDPVDIAVDKSAIYFTDRSPSGDSLDGTLYKLAKP